MTKGWQWTVSELIWGRGEDEKSMNGSGATSGSRNIAKLDVHKASRKEKERKLEWATDKRKRL